MYHYWQNLKEDLDTTLEDIDMYFHFIYSMIYPIKYLILCIIKSARMSALNIKTSTNVSVNPGELHLQKLHYSHLSASTCGSMK